MLTLDITKRTDLRLLARMTTHYSQPRGFVGRSICYACLWNGDYYGHIVAGSATRFLPNRNGFLGISLDRLNLVINNIFFNVTPIDGRYPCRNFTSKIVDQFVTQSQHDWRAKYGDLVVGFESLVEKPRTGDLYRKAGWELIGETKGFSCKRQAGIGTDKWTGQRVWNTDPTNLRPKLVFAYKIPAYPGTTSTTTP